MKLITYRKDQTEAVGILSPDGTSIAPVNDLGAGTYSSMNDLIRNASEDALDTLKKEACKEDRFTLPASDVQILAPIPEPLQDIICLGLNYTEHAKESAAYKKKTFVPNAKYPVYFAKRVNYAPGDGETIPPHDDIEARIDYESELAVIIGKDAKNVAPEDVKDYIFGYTILNDMSARELQTNHQQWYFGKSLEGFTPMGPVIVTADDISYPPALPIRSYINGELRQNSTTDMLIFSIDFIVSQLSHGFTIKAGSIISTGTPKGVGIGMDPPTFLKKGDEIVCEIEGIGRLRNILG